MAGILKKHNYITKSIDTQRDELCHLLNKIKNASDDFLLFNEFKEKSTEDLLNAYQWIKKNKDPLKHASVITEVLEKRIDSGVGVTWGEENDNCERYIKNYQRVNY